MNYRKIMLIACLLLALITIGAVSAEDSSDNLTVDDGDDNISDSPVNNADLLGNGAGESGTDPDNGDDNTDEGDGEGGDDNTDEGDDEGGDEEDESFRIKSYSSINNDTRIINIEIWDDEAPKYGNFSVTITNEDDESYTINHEIDNADRFNEVVVFTVKDLNITDYHIARIMS